MSTDSDDSDFDSTKTVTQTRRCGCPRVGRGRKRQSFVKKTTFLFAKNSVDLFPTSMEADFLTKNGLGRRENLKFERSWSIQEAKAFIYSHYKNVLLDSIGFRFGKCSTSRRIAPIDMTSVYTMEDIFNIVKQGLILLIPKRDINLHEMSREIKKEEDERVSLALGVSRQTVSRIANTNPTQQGTDSQEEPGSSKSKYTPRKKKKTEDLHEVVKMEVRNVLYSIFVERKPLTVKSLKDELIAKEVVDISTQSLWRLLRHIGFSFKQKDNRRTLTERGSIALQRAEFLRRYKENQDSPTKRQVIFLGDTSISAKGRRKRPCPDETARSGRKPSKGGLLEERRFIALHAGHTAGFVKDASLIYCSNSGAITSQNFLNWVKSKVVPYIKEPSLIVMHSAPHCSVLAEKKPTGACTRSEILQWLKERNIPVEDDAFKAELMALVKTHMQPKRYVVDEYLREHGHEVLRVPPFHCEFNAIELIWEKATQYYYANIGQEVCDDGKVFKLWQQALQQCTAETWLDVVQRTDEVIDNWYNRQHLLDDVEELIIDVGDDSSASDESDTD